MHSVLFRAAELVVPRLDLQPPSRSSSASLVASLKEDSVSRGTDCALHSADCSHSLSLRALWRFQPEQKPHGQLKLKNMSSTAADSAAAASAAASSEAPPSWVRIEYEGPNNTLAVMRLHVGQRVRVETDGPAAALGPVPASTEEEFASTAKATVRYIGPVAAARDPLAVMIGIEWDDASRGKNDGMVGGHRYFTCSVSTGKPGSFIHPARIKVADASSLLRAIETKYETRFKQDANPSLYLVAEHNAKAAAAAASPSPTSASATAPQSTPSPPPSGAAPARHIPVVFQGEEYMQNKIASKLASLIDMTLTQGHISRAFEPQLPGPTDPAAEPDTVDLLSTADQSALLARKIVRCETMDLTDNLFRDWVELGMICRTLPTLKLLAVSQNNLSFATMFESIAASAASSTPSQSPSLLPLLSTSFRNLSVLVLNGVPDAWSSVLALACAGALPLLDELHLCKNQIQTLSEGVQQQMQRQQQADRSVPAMRRALAEAFSRLHTLELSFNALTAWSEVSLLSDLPLLAKLLLNSNNLTSVEYEETSAPAEESKSSEPSAARAPFAALVSIGLNSNSLSGFSSVSALDRFPSLSEVRLQSNAPLEAATMAMNAAASGSGGAQAKAISQVLNVVTEDQAHKLVSSAGDALTAASIPAAGLSSARDAAPIAFAPSAQSASLLRLQLIARLPRVVALNRSRITDRERIDAEKYYLLVCFQAMQSLSDEQKSSSNLDHLFPRYSSLVPVHGDPAATVSALQKQMVEPTGSTLASKLVEVTMVLAEHEGGADADADAAASSSAAAPLSIPGLRVVQSATKKLSSSLTVQAARMLLDKSFKIAAHRKALYTMQWREPSQPALAHPLDEPLKSLSYFGLTNGAWIVLLQNK